MRYLIVDDEAPARQLLRETLVSLGPAEIVEAANGLAALQAFQAGAFQAIFLDIQMPELGGLEVGRMLASEAHCPPLVFVTAFDRHAVEAFELEALDYLLKPVDGRRLQRTLQRLAAPGSERLERVGQLLQPGLLPRLALLDEASGIRHIVPVHEILWVTTRDEKTYVQVPGRCLRAHETLSALESRLPAAQFLRCHRAYVVNLARVEAAIPWQGRAYNLKVRGSHEEIPLSRNYVSQFRQKTAWL